MPRIPAHPPAQIKPAGLSRLQQLAASVASTRTKEEAKPLVAELRRESRHLRALVPPMVACLLARVSRDAEAASGSVIDKSRRLADMQETWELLMRLIGGL